MTDETMTADVATIEPEDVTAEVALSTTGTTLLNNLMEENTSSIKFLGFDEDSPEGLVRVFNAQEDGDSLDASGKTELTLDGIMLVPGVRVDPVSGSRTPCVNTILLTPEGDYVSQSNGIARTAARIIVLYGANGWPEGGIKVKVTEQKLAGGRTYKKLRLMA